MRNVRNVWNSKRGTYRFERNVSHVPHVYKTYEIGRKRS
ncbi:hypothetical protein Vi05172_g7744 [Venturia inaequalis]|nr:hypothetical protein Vi05172_g7744 [Venturia inaequalis]